MGALRQSAARLRHGLHARFLGAMRRGALAFVGIRQEPPRLEVLQSLATRAGHIDLYNGLERMVLGVYVGNSPSLASYDNTIQPKIKQKRELGYII